MKPQHQSLASGRWEKIPFMEQMANVGSEIERTINWKNKNKNDYSEKAFVRGLELLSLTIQDFKNKKRLKELTRLREALIDYFQFNNQFESSDQLWQKYFYAFNFAARRNF